MRALSLGFGMAVMFSSMVPLINFVIMPAAVCGATALWLERCRLN
jgi:CysZ protein